MEEPSDLISLSQEEVEAVAEEEAEAEVEASEIEVAEAVASVEVEDLVVAEVETEVEEEEEEAEALVHQEEDSNMTPMAHLTAPCYERFERHRVAESKYNNINPSCFWLPIVAS